MYFLLLVMLWQTDTHGRLVHVIDADLLLGPLVSVASLETGGQLIPQSSSVRLLCILVLVCLP